MQVLYTCLHGILRFVRHWLIQDVLRVVSVRAKNPRQQNEGQVSKKGLEA